MKERKEELSEQTATLKERISSFELQLKDYEKQLKASEEKLAKTAIIDVKDFKPETTSPYGVTFNTKSLIRSMTSAEQQIDTKKARTEENVRNLENKQFEEEIKDKTNIEFAEKKPKVADVPLTNNAAEQHNITNQIQESPKSEHSVERHNSSCKETVHNIK